MKKVLLIVCLIGILLSGCSTRTKTTTTPAVKPTAAGAEKQRTTIRFAVADWELPIYEPVIKAFEEKNPDLHVQVVSVNEVLGLGSVGNIQVPEDADQRLAAAADVVVMGISRQTVKDGLIYDLTPLMQTDPNFKSSDFFPGTLESYQWNGGTWALPMRLTYRLIFFDKKAFDEAGVSYPQAGWTWSDLLAKAQALTKEDGDATRWGFICPRSLAYWLVESMAGNIADYTSEPPEALFNEAKVTEAVRWYTDLYLQEKVMPFFKPVASEGETAISTEETLIDKGQAAMWPDYSALWWYRNQQGKVGVVPFPESTPGAKSTPAWVEGIVMSAGTTQPNAAWRWMDFLSQQSLKSVGQGVTYVPARLSAVESSGYWDSLDKDLANALRYAVDHSYVVRESVGYNAFTSAMLAILEGDKTVEMALADAQEQVKEEAEGKEAEKTSATPVPTVVVATAKATEPASKNAVTITFVPGLGSLNLDPYRRLAEKFHEEHPDIIVEVKSIDLTSGTTPSLTSIAKSADCFQWYPSFQDPKNREAVLSMSAFLDADKSFNTNDYFAQALKQFNYQDQLLGLPADITPFIIEYNKDLFDAAGIDYPKVGWTWDDFLAAAIALTNGEGDSKQYGYVAEVYESSDMLLMLERLGAKIVNEKSDPASVTFNDPSVVEAMDWYAKLSTEYAVKPTYITDVTKLLGASSAYMEREGLINKGRAAMWTNAGTSAILFGKRSGLNVGAAPLPARADGLSNGSLQTVSGYFISADTEHRQACWLWLTYLSAQPEAAQGLPARRSVAESAEYREQVGEDLATAYLASVKEAEKPSTLQLLSDEEWLGGAAIWLYQAYGKVVEGKVSPEAALDEAQKLADDYRACMVSAGDYSQKTWEGCLKATDPTLPAYLFSSGG